MRHDFSVRMKSVELFRAYHLFLIYVAVNLTLLRDSLGAQTS